MLGVQDQRVYLGNDTSSAPKAKFYYRFDSFVIADLLERLGDQISGSQLAQER